MADKHSGGVSFYVVVALILGAITYLEFALVEYDVAWLSRSVTIAALVIMSLIKFALVVAIYMHLRDDDRTYTGFFTSGIVLALGTFVALTFLFTVRSAARQPTAAVQAEPGAQVQELEPLVAERPFGERLRVPPPKTQRLELPLPSAPQVEYTLASSGSLPAAQPEAQAPAAEGAAGAEAASFAWAQLGEETFSANCAACHQATGQGVPGAFPPLADHLPDLYNAEGGRSYLIQVVLYGLQGAISVAGSSYNGVMPPFAQLSDEQLAATLNHELTSWGNDAQVDAFEPILPEEIAAERDAGLSSAQVYGARPDLGE